jgi:hypothetical protein
LPISAVDTITPAFHHTKRQLFQPFRFGQWSRLALVGLLAGELGSGGSRFPSSFPGPSGPSGHGLGQIFPKIDPALLGGLIAVLVVTAFIFVIVMMYISSVMRFILFDSVVTKQCDIGRGWSRRQSSGWRYFLWQLGFMLVSVAALVVLVGIPLAFAFAMGWFHAPREHVLGFVLGGIVLLPFVLLFFFVAAVVHVLTKDFVVPQMALEEIGAMDGWRRLWPMIQSEKGGYALYVIMKIVLAIGAAIIIGIVSVILILVVAIPTAGLGIAAVLAAKTAGLTWNVFTITLGVVVACILLAAFFYLMALISVPAIVFFPAYAIHFFAARYRPLSLLLYPLPPPAQEPPLPLQPQPAG